MVWGGKKRCVNIEVTEKICIFARYAYCCYACAVLCYVATWLYDEKIKQ